MADGTAPYRAAGTWVDIFDHSQLARPEATVRAMARRGVQTLYLETGNDSQRSAIPYADATARFIEAAHAEGMWVVAWYLPGYDDLARDLRRSLAAIDFTTPQGEGFDGFAFDIESTNVRSVAARSARAVTLARRLRAAVRSPTRSARSSPTPTPCTGGRSPTSRCGRTSTRGFPWPTSRSAAAARGACVRSPAATSRRSASAPPTRPRSST